MKCVFITILVTLNCFTCWLTFVKNFLIFIRMPPFIPFASLVFSCVAGRCGEESNTSFLRLSLFTSHVNIRQHRAFCPAQLICHYTLCISCHNKKSPVILGIEHCLLAINRNPESFFPVVLRIISHTIFSNISPKNIVCDFAIFIFVEYVFHRIFLSDLQQNS